MSAYTKKLWFEDTICKISNIYSILWSSEHKAQLISFLQTGMIPSLIGFIFFCIRELNLGPFTYLECAEFGVWTTELQPSPEWLNVTNHLILTIQKVIVHTMSSFSLTVMETVNIVQYTHYSIAIF
jgi:hypothetical protein